jgi:hypothetical protein
MIKHVGRSGERKVVVVFNEVPNEPHMCIAIYPDLLQQQMHDDLMKAIESTEGQAAENLGDALGSKYFSDGSVILNRLHNESMLKKIQCEQIILTPTPQSHVRLDEMNKILNEMKTGQEAVDRLAKLDSEAGMSGKQVQRDAMGRRVNERNMDIGGPGANVPLPGALTETSHKGVVNANPQGTMAAPVTGALSDDAIANNMKAQADKMATEAQGMIAEAQRMQNEANAMMGVPAVPAKKKRGRPAKAKA